MPHDVTEDQLAVIKVEGLHCHGCEKKLKVALLAQPGVHEVEVDFNTGLLSVLFNKSETQVRKLMNTIDETGYSAVGFNQPKASE